MKPNELPVWSVLCDFQSIVFQSLKLHVHTSWYKHIYTKRKVYGDD
jgi:hypothetical protein